jgi:hypothetical protein
VPVPRDMFLKPKAYDMKSGQEAAAQYSELASALVQIGMSWIVEEVEEVISRGKAIPFRDLSEEESILYEGRLTEEARKGLVVGRAKASDSIGVPYEPHERLALLVDAVERAIMASELSYSYVSRFAARLGISSVRLENPVDVGIAANALGPRIIPPTEPALVSERLAVLHHVLHDEVLS